MWSGLETRASSRASERTNAIDQFTHYEIGIWWCCARVKNLPKKILHLHWSQMLAKFALAVRSLRSRSKSIPWGLWMRANGLQDEEKKSVKRNEKEVMQDKQLRYLCLLILFSTFWRTIFGRFYLHKMQDKVWENWLEHSNSTEPNSTSQRRSI